LEQGASAGPVTEPVAGNVEFGLKPNLTPKRSFLSLGQPVELIR
jgi:hypothetical protein